ncbi:MAG: hypothetical protein M1825_003712 [Sarcosagium campestre]|nr:MAG: hypothetical protein M1825_003712 [Sarcosagium campestre]
MTAVLTIDTIFESYTIESAAPQNTINLELPIQPLHRALRSALSATSASLRLTKKDGIPLLSLTVVTSTTSGGIGGGGGGSNADADASELSFGLEAAARETHVTQEVPVRVLSAQSVDGIHEPRCREPDVHILLPSLLQLKAISDRFTKLASASSHSSAASTSVTGRGGGGTSLMSAAPKLELAANMLGSLRLSTATDAMSISSLWTGLSNPGLDPREVEGGEQGLREHPSTRMRQLAERTGGQEGWAKVRIDGRDWSRVLSVGRLGGRVVACKSLIFLSILTTFLDISCIMDEERLRFGLFPSSPIRFRARARSDSLCLPYEQRRRCK